MKLADVEITLSQWATSKWTVILTRMAMLAVPVLGAAFVLVWGAVQTDAAREVSNVKQSVVGVTRTLSERAADSDAFQVELRKAVGELGAKVDGLSDDLFSTRVDVGVIKRLVIELRDQQEAAAALLADPLPRPSTVASAGQIDRVPVLQ